MGPEQIWLVGAGGLAAFFANLIYSMGGTSPFKLAIRRFGSSGILAAAANGIAIYLHAWTWEYILIYPVLAAGFALPYGADSLIVKVLKRTAYALAIIGAVLIGCFVHHFTGASLLVLLCAFFCGTISVILGAANPFSNAPLEQFLICQVLTLFVPFLAWIK